ncbi:acyclic terpene utilization AtuA family protein [Ottowia thiooxydans]|uniref:acyclic terpene utilization AtuA family protein n=1 Tax=Ottowia thiooxydans TaxID=219182 RepID=UPI00040509A5|nr:acyclic terpene utilization AtuA family protein [Ottowia thiooxydans]
MNPKTVLIGGASAFIGDSILGPTQLVKVPGMQYLVFDYLAEMTLSGFSQTRKTNAQLGYSTEFVEYVLPQIAVACAEKGIRLVANAGGLNPEACAGAIRAQLAKLNLPLKVAYAVGDDCMHMVDQLRASGTQDFYTKAPVPHSVDSANVYLGAPPIAKALALGADIVVTGRIVDSAATLGILMHEFGWGTDQWDLLASGSLVGHVLECGAQATGGIFTDWERVPDWENIGYPYATCHADGSFVLSKAAGTGGLVEPMTVNEQILYEVADPAHYVLPDVVCDFTAVSTSAIGPDQVLVQGARGSLAPDTYKMSASYQAGYRCTAQVSVFGMNATGKARRTNEALLNRTRRLLKERGFADFVRHAGTVVGAEDGYGPHAQPSHCREAIARLVVTHDCAQALDLFSRESRAPGVSFAPGTTSGSSLTLNTRPAVEPLHRLFTCLVKKARLSLPQVIMAGETHEVVLTTTGSAPHPYIEAERAQGEPTTDSPEAACVPLMEIAHARSGDKGDTSNVAVFARNAAHFDHLRRVLTTQRVRTHLGHLVKGGINRYEASGLHALNFVMDQALDGGGPSSLRNDPMGKGMAQMLLEMKIARPAASS